MNDQPTLSRRLNLPLLTIFGLGTMVGAGIYVLVGEILAVSGSFAPWAFLMAAVVAGFTAMSYGELASHYPKSAGEAVYVDQAFSRPLLTQLTGWAVVTTGLVSSGTLANGFAGYLAFFYPGAEGIAATGFILVLGAIAAWGIGQTVWFAAAITATSIFGLLAVLAMSGRYLANFPDVWPTLVPTSASSAMARHPPPSSPTGRAIAIAGNVSRSRSWSRNRRGATPASTGSPTGARSRPACGPTST